MTQKKKKKKKKKKKTGGRARRSDPGAGIVRGSPIWRTPAHTHAHPHILMHTCNSTHAHTRTGGHAPTVGARKHAHAVGHAGTHAH